MTRTALGRAHLAHRMSSQPSPPPARSTRHAGTLCAWPSETMLHEVVSVVSERYMHVAGHLMLLYRHTRYTCLSVPVKHLQACRRASIPFFAAVLARAVVTDGHLAGEVGERGDDGDAARRSRHDARPRPCAALAAAERLQLTVNADGADGVGSSFRFWGDFGASGVATSRIRNSVTDGQIRNRCPFRAPTGAPAGPWDSPTPSPHSSASQA